MHFNSVKKLSNTLLPALLVAMLFSACRREDDYSSWETNMLTPIASTSLTINDLLQDSLLKSNPDSSLQLVYEQELYKLATEDFFTVPDTEIKATLTLERLQLADRTLTQSIKLSQVYPPAVFLNGQTTNVPAQTLTSIPPTPIDASSFFQTAVLKEGFMDITIQNGFPVGIQEVRFKLINKVTLNVLVDTTMTDINPGESKTASANLAGKQVDAAMEVQVTSLKTYATTSPVLINSNDKVDITIDVYGLKPQSATAVFPAQSVYSKDENALYDFGGAQMKKLRIKSGTLRLRIVSTIEENMTVDYKIPHALKNGNSVHEILKVKAAPVGGSTDVIRDIPLEGYTIDLRGKNPPVDDTVNAFWNLLDVTLDYSGIQRSISLSDSVYIYYGLLDIVPEWAEGYFGQQIAVAGPDAVPFDFFRNTSGSLTLEDVSMGMDITNGIGANAEITVGNITSANTRTGKRVKLNATTLSSPIPIDRATDNPFTEKKVHYDYTQSNSNVKDFVQNLPDRLEYSLNVKTNPNGNVSNWKDFIYSFSELKAVMKLAMPLALKADNLELADTLPFEMFSAGALNRVKEGTFNILVDNSFPLSAKLQLYVVDDNGTVIDSIMNLQHNFVQAGQLDMSTGKVTAPVRSVVKTYFTRERMDKVKAGKRLLVKAIFDTPASATQPVKIYNTYKFDIKLTGDFIYEQRF